jgi:hypothetical protein
MKIRPVAAEFFHAVRTDRQRDGFDTANSRFSQLRERPTIYARLYSGLCIVFLDMRDP